MTMERECCDKKFGWRMRQKDRDGERAHKCNSFAKNSCRNFEKKQNSTREE